MSWLQAMLPRIACESYTTFMDPAPDDSSSALEFSQGCEWSISVVALV
jgi:hypothetical protein